MFSGIHCSPMTQRASIAVDEIPLSDPPALSDPEQEAERTDHATAGVAS